MKTYEIDFHYYTLEEALRVVEGIINQARLNNEAVYCSFITGRGKIQKELFKLLAQVYELNPLIPFYNQGLILVELY